MNFPLSYQANFLVYFHRRVEGQMYLGSKRENQEVYQMLDLRVYRLSRTVDGMLDLWDQAEYCLVVVELDSGVQAEYV